MFHNRSFTVLVVLALLAAATLVLGTAVGTAPAASSGKGITASAIPAQPKDYAGLKDAQLDQIDDARIGSARITVSGGEDAYLPMQKEQRLFELNERFYPSDEAASTLRSNRIQRLLELNERRSSKGDSQFRLPRDQRLLELNLP